MPEPRARPAPRGTAARWVIAGAVLCAGVATTAAAPPAATPPAPASEARANSRPDRDFTVTLDDKPIGTHRFRFAGTPAQRQVTSEAEFVVKLLGIAVYRYRHQAVEQWRGDCLVALTASTEENGKRQQVRAAAPAAVAARPPEAGEPGEPGKPAESGEPGAEPAQPAQSAQPTQPLEGCPMSFAYWNPAIRQQARLFNAQTGRFENIAIASRGEQAVEVRGQSVTAAHWRITGTPEPIDLFYSPQGEWIGLDSTVGGGRRLSYRLK